MEVAKKAKRESDKNSADKSKRTGINLMESSPVSALLLICVSSYHQDLIGKY